MNTAPTDSPEVFALKEQFYALDDLEQKLKLVRCGELETPEMVQVRLQKKEIAEKIFKK